MSALKQEKKIPSSCKQPSFLPPTDKKFVIRDGLCLGFQLIWLFLLIPPSVLLSFFKRIFPPAGKSLQGRVVLVTGGGRGLGRGLCLEFAREGAIVAVADINSTTATQTAQEIVKAGGKARPYIMNVARVAEIKALHCSITEDLGPVDILVNNAAIMLTGSIMDTSQEELRAVMDVNLLSYFWTVQEFLPDMKRRNSGHIVAMCSGSAVWSLANASAYTASKCGVKGLMEVLRGELNSSPSNNIKTTTVMPYFVNTSEDYVNEWDLRFPPLSIEEVVKTTVAGVKRDQVVVEIPNGLCLRAYLVRLLPQNLQDWVQSIWCGRVIPPNGEDKENHPVHHLIKNISHKRVD